MMEHQGPDLPWSNFRSELNSRLLNERTLVLNEALTSSVAARISEQLTVLDAESEESIQIMMSSVPEGEMEAGLSVHDLLQSMVAPVTVLGAGRIVGPGVVAFAGAPSGRRFALPHARFRFDEPRGRLGRGSTKDLDTEAEELSERRQRVIEVLAAATGQSEEQVSTDLSDRRALEAEAAVDYGLVCRIVENRREIE